MTSTFMETHTYQHICGPQVTPDGAAGIILSPNENYSCTVKYAVCQWRCTHNYEVPYLRYEQYSKTRGIAHGLKVLGVTQHTQL